VDKCEQEQEKDEMKKTLQYVLVLTLVLPVLLACQMFSATPTPLRLPTSASIPTLSSDDTEPTDLPSPIEPVATDAAEPTPTLEAVPTPITLPDELNKVFSGVSVEYQDNFDDATDVLPPGWISSEPLAARGRIDGEFEIKSASQQNGTGVTVYFSNEPITPNTGVYFTFQYTGMLQNFTLGMDAVGSNGQITSKAGQKDFYSVAMQMQEKKVTAQSVLRSSSTKSPFRGDLKLEEGTWYDIALGFDGDKNFIIKIWSPADPRKQLIYLYKSKEFPTSYYFVSSVSSKRSLLIDNFTVFKFDQILGK
jgi:hypothetical protein